MNFSLLSETPGFAVSVVVTCVLMAVLAYNSYYNKLELLENAPHLPPLTGKLFVVGNQPINTITLFKWAIN
ncbi:hypothetical protein J6590_069155 [Homalodisca vitripennis]|nr:hypothetical protein J6590_069155 [Homalodisca vitripennis]